MNQSKYCAPAILCMFCLASTALGHAECIGPAGLRGIRVDGQLMPFTTGVRAVAPGQPIASQNGQDRLGFGRYSRDGNQQICTGGLFLGRPRPGGGGFGPGRRPRSDLDCTTTFEDTTPGAVSVRIHLVAHADMRLEGIYFYIHLPAADYAGAKTDLPNGLRLSGDHHALELTLSDSRHISLTDNLHQSTPTRDIYFPLWTGNLAAAQNVDVAFTLKASGDVDNAPATVTVDPFQPGSPFAGIGGNFRIQGPADPAQIQYNLDHLRVVWGRIAMPWNVWQPTENQDPIQSAAGHLDDGVKAAMEMGRTLAQRNISMIISDWAAPDWALMPRDPNSPPFRGRRLNPQKWPQICKSIGSYLLYMKQNYGAEPRLFSFNESDIGINVLQSPQEHADTIKRLGSYFASQGLTTKMLLGDTGDPTPMHFIDTAMNDPEAVKYIGAVSFHSWRGGTVEQFTRWGNAARQLNVPLLVAEGGTDSNSFAYPNLFLEPWYGLGEIAEYVEICRICQPLSILQWQLTNDYSLLIGGRDGAPLKPTQRFWNLTQLDMTPPGSAALPITCDKPAISACAYLDPATSISTIHLVNEGPTRLVTISGFPRFAMQLHVYVTDATRSVQELPLLTILRGKATLTLDSQSFTTLMGSP